jgi:hypothetical protein
VALLMTGRLDAAPDLRDGDLIFQESQSRQSAAIFAATGSRLTHMGIVRLRDGEPYVVESRKSVGEMPLADWIARGKGGRYMLYRLRGLSVPQADAILAEADALKGRPYDIFFRPGKEAIYCSELPRLAFAAAGLSIGSAQTLADLEIDDPAVQALFAERWRQHPDCAADDGPDGCWQRLQKQSIVTPASIAADDRLDLVFSNF